MIELTTKQKEYLDIITKYKERYNKMPTQKELAKYFKVTPAAVCLTIAVLERKGVL